MVSLTIVHVIHVCSHTTVSTEGLTIHLGVFAVTHACSHITVSTEGEFEHPSGRVCRASEQKILGGSSTSSSDPDLASLDPEEEASSGSGGAQQGAVAIHDTSQVHKMTVIADASQTPMPHLLH